MSRKAASKHRGIVNIPGRPQANQFLPKWGWQKVFKFCTTFAQTHQLFTRVPISSSALISRPSQQSEIISRPPVCVPRCRLAEMSTFTHCQNRQAERHSWVNDVKVNLHNTHRWGQRGYCDGNARKNKQLQEKIAPKNVFMWTSITFHGHLWLHLHLSPSPQTHARHTNKPVRLFCQLLFNRWRCYVNLLAGIRARGEC